MKLQHFLKPEQVELISATFPKAVKTELTATRKTPKKKATPMVVVKKQRRIQPV